jgi:hypothetical protein
MKSLLNNETIVAYYAYIDTNFWFDLSGAIFEDSSLSSALLAAWTHQQQKPMVCKLAQLKKLNILSSNFLDSHTLPTTLFTTGLQNILNIIRNNHRVIVHQGKLFRNRSIPSYASSSTIASC